MPFKLQDVMADVGRDLNDASLTRWPNPDRLGYVNDAIAAAKSLRPDLFLSTIATPYAPLAQDADVPLPDRYRPALGAYVRHRCLLRSTDRQDDARAQSEMKLFAESMRSL